MALGLTARRSRQFGRRAVVSWRNGQWTFEMDGRVLAPVMHGWADTSRWDHEADDIFFWKYRPQPGDVVVDVGAGIGTELFRYSATIGESGTVYALEAHPETFKALCTLYNLNKGGAIDANVVLDCIAASDHSGTIQIEDTDRDVENRLVRTGGIPTAAATLDEFVHRRNIDHIDFLKMNIEGAERDALRAAEHALSITQHGAISCHDFRADVTGDEYFRTKAFVRSILSEAGLMIDERPRAVDPWTRDYLYITRP